MQKLHFTIDIQAPKEKVWDVMLADETYRQWTEIFNPSGGSWYEGNWEEGSDIRFIGPDEEGNEGGMVSKIVANRPYEFISIEHLGEIVNGVEDTTSERVKAWQGAHENYTFKENDDVTTVEVDLDTVDEFADMFTDAWPKALAKLKELVETA